MAGTVEPDYGKRVFEVALVEGGEDDECWRCFAEPVATVNVATERDPQWICADCLRAALEQIESATKGE